MTDKKIKIEFAPGCFDNFEGSQEELDDIIASIQEAAESGELNSKSQKVTDEMFAELTTEEQEIILEALSGLGSNTSNRKIQ